MSAVGRCAALPARTAISAGIAANFGIDFGIDFDIDRVGSKSEPILEMPALTKNTRSKK